MPVPQFLLHSGPPFSWGLSYKKLKAKMFKHHYLDFVPSLLVLDKSLYVCYKHGDVRRKMEELFLYPEITCHNSLHQDNIEFLERWKLFWIVLQKARYLCHSLISNRYCFSIFFCCVFSSFLANSRRKDGLHYTFYITCES